MKHYVVGFLFNRDRTKVALIRKERPDWQRGRLNGIGGKVERGETTLQAMIREFREETGATVRTWQFFCRIHWRGGVIHFFHATRDANLKQTTDEAVGWYGVRSINTLKTIGNLRWLVPMALDKDTLNAVVHDLS